MGIKQKVTVTMQSANRRLSLAERRAAQTETLSTQQATLKQEAADRREQRANATPPPASTPRRAIPARRSTSR